MTRFGTMSLGNATRAFRVEGDHIALLDAGDVGELLRSGLPLDEPGTPAPMPAPQDLRPPVTRPSKVVCVGLNYRDHAREVGKPVPEYPTLFAKYPSAFVGAAEPIHLPALSVSDRVDWEAELVVVVGTRVFQADADEAAAAIFGYTAMNDVSMRDWQRRTEEWLQGKNFERSTPIGPVVVSADELDLDAGLRVETLLGDRVVQSGSTDDLVFRPVDIVRYITQFMSLEPGDLIATGTPAGVGVSRTPSEFLDDGDLLITRITGIGELRNPCLREASS
ncbi:fumarylacetoacetate hydrolase family protein [Microbacterium chocolatum]|uniref:fumarylacetoacetate hydrolase family protein n=1 Tax=Microbacterium aurantiacum TaxID=162393 RepID=UPI00338FB0A2